MRRNLAPSRIGQTRGFVPPLKSSNNGVVPKPKLDEVPTKPIFSPNASTPHVTSSPEVSQEHSISSQNESSKENSRYFSAVWCKQSTRKHKKWEGDAFLIARPPKSRLVILKDTNGKEIGRGSGLPISKVRDLNAGEVLSFGGKDVELLDELNEEQFKTQLLKPSDEESPAPTPAPVPNVRFKPFAVPSRIGSPFPKYTSTGKLKPMFDVDHPDAIVLPRPRGSDDVVDVVVDPHIGRHLRPHQIEGVIFLYKCVTGIQLEGSFGAILADEMGLGKTLQTIAVIWTLLRQGPNGKPIAKRVMVLAPSSLVKNWQAEFNKWLGSERITTFAVETGGQLGEYIKYPNKAPVLILSYEMFTRSFDQIQDHLSLDLIVCDEGHRLKNSSIKASQMLAQLCETDRRIVLTGTPLQNELKEFFAIVNVVCPDILGTESKFLRQYEDPIVRSKQPNASEFEVREGNERMEELQSLTGQFMLRRTQDIISKYLPPKSEHVVFCQMTAIQAFAFEKLQETLDYADDCVLAK